MGRTPGGLLIILLTALAAFSAPGESVMKTSAKGIFCLLVPDTVERPFPNLAGQPCWTNPYVQGVSLRSNWSTVEPSEGKFDWSFFDEGIALAARHHKNVALYVTAGVTTPNWVYAAGAYRWDINKVRRNGEIEPMTEPLPWDPVFFSKWSALIDAFAARYDSSPYVAYVVMAGPGRRTETFFVDSPQDIAKLDSMGGLQHWVQGSEKIIDRYASAFQKTPFIMAMAPPVPADGGVAALKELVDYGAGHYPGHYGVMSDSLRPNYSLSSYGAQAIRSLSRRGPVGFQMLLPSKGGRQMSEGSLEDALNRGVAIGAHFLEVYAVDCRDPGQTATLQRIGAKLVKND